MPQEEALRADWFTWEWVRDIWVRRGLCDIERGNEIIAYLEQEIGDPHNILTRSGQELINRMVRDGRRPGEPSTPA